MCVYIYICTQYINMYTYVYSPKLPFWYRKWSSTIKFRGYGQTLHHFCQLLLLWAKVLMNITIADRKPTVVWNILKQHPTWLDRKTTIVCGETQQFFNKVCLATPSRSSWPRDFGGPEHIRWPSHPWNRRCTNHLHRNLARIGTIHGVRSSPD